MTGPKQRYGLCNGRLRHRGHKLHQRGGGGCCVVVVVAVWVLLPVVRCTCFGTMRSTTTYILTMDLFGGGCSGDSNVGSNEEDEDAAVTVYPFTAW